MSGERALVFRCGDDRLLGIVHPGAADSTVGIVIVVGGPQYRVGSHRQFVTMAREFARAELPVLRFDYRGMGDADGAARPFDTVGDDIRAAVDLLVNEVRSISKVVLFGLCDAASACLMYAPTDPRIAGLILANPWVRTTTGEARSYLRHYYFQRVLQKSFWKKLGSGKFGAIQSVSQFIHVVRSTFNKPVSEAPGQMDDSEVFVDRMLHGLRAFDGETLFLISGRDLTASEFTDLCASDRNWKTAIERRCVSFSHLPPADHTMSTANDLDNAIVACLDWLRPLRHQHPYSDAS